MCVHVNKCSVVCSCCLHKGQSGDWFKIGSILCLYVFNIGDLPVRSCESVLRVFLGRDSSSGFIFGGMSFKILLFVLVFKYV